MAKHFISQANAKFYSAGFVTDDWQERTTRFSLDRAKPDKSFLEEVANQLRTSIDNVDLIDYGDAQRTFKRGIVLRAEDNSRHALAVAEFIYSTQKEGFLTVKAKNEEYMGRVLNGLRSYAHLAVVETHQPIVPTMEERV